jgi:hypothetical protein
MHTVRSIVAMAAVVFALAAGCGSGKKYGDACTGNGQVGVIGDDNSSCEACPSKTTASISCTGTCSAPILGVCCCE